MAELLSSVFPYLELFERMICVICGFLRTVCESYIQKLACSESVPNLWTKLRQELTATASMDHWQSGSTKLRQSVRITNTDGSLVAVVSN
jgi:hypothetical protein